jgi:SAM-dependent methyltransferase
MPDASMALYDRIGHGYAHTREADPRIARAIEEELGDARSVVNVGAGAGSYEPAHLEVTAVEPSRAMLDQRPPGAAPAVQAPAEELPFADDSFDAALASMTVHHWDDLERGLDEMRRVARRRIVIFTWDPEVAAESWLTAEYLPELRELDLFRFESPGALAARIGAAAVRTVPVPVDCRDGFIEAFWGRPEAYLDPKVRAGMSGMRAMDQGVVDGAMSRLAADLESGDWDRRHGHLRHEAELDLGYRVVRVEL